MLTTTGCENQEKGGNGFIQNWKRKEQFNNKSVRNQNM